MSNGLKRSENHSSGTYSNARIEHENDNNAFLDDQQQQQQVTIPQISYASDSIVGT